MRGCKEQQREIEVSILAGESFWLNSGHGSMDEAYNCFFTASIMKTISS